MSEGPRVVAFEVEKLSHGSIQTLLQSCQTVSIGRGCSLRRSAFLSKVLPTRVYSDWAKDKLQMIAEAELFAALVAKELWFERIRDRKVLHAIGNAGLSALILYSSSSATLCNLLEAAVVLEAESR
eukprot:767784-Amphidinium_carterae.1